MSEAGGHRRSFACHPRPAERERAHERALAAERLGQGLSRWSRNRQGWAFGRLLGGAAIAAAESDVRERTRQALREAGKAARRAQEAAVQVSRLPPRRRKPYRR